MVFSVPYSESDRVHKNCCASHKLWAQLLQVIARPFMRPKEIQPRLDRAHTHSSSGLWAFNHESRLTRHPVADIHETTLLSCTSIKTISSQRWCTYSCVSLTGNACVWGMAAYKGQCLSTTGLT